MALKKEGLSRNTSQYKVAVRKTELLTSDWGVWQYSRVVSDEADVFNFGDEALLC